MLVVLSGLTSAGKDAVAEKILQHPAIRALKMSRLVTYTDRLPRSGEINEYDYFFVTPEKMDELHKNDMLAEDPVQYGTSRKATGKEQLEETIHGKHKLWRIDPSLTLKIAKGEFFKESFDSPIANSLQKDTIIFFLVADRDELIERRKKRDGDMYNESDYQIRDKQDEEILPKLQEVPNVEIINNPDGDLDQTVEKIINKLVLKMKETDIPTS